MSYWATGGDIDYGGHTYLGGPVIERDAVETSIGIDVPSIDVRFFCDINMQLARIAGVQLHTAAATGMLDGAELKVERIFSADPGGTILGSVHVFEGRVADTSIDMTSVTMTVRAHTELLDVPIPRRVYEPTCSRTLGDSGCGVNKAAYAQTLTVSAGTTAGVINCSVTGSGTFDLGTAVFPGGITRAIRRHVTGTIYLANPLPSVPAVGSTFTVYPGCTKDKTTCQTKFGNLARFAGFPYVPQPETAL